MVDASSTRPPVGTEPATRRSRFWELFRYPGDGYFVDVLHLTALWGFAVSQPIFDLLSQSAEFFIARRADPTDIVIFVCLLSFFVPCMLALIEYVAAMSHTRLRKQVHATLICGLLTLLTMLSLHVQFNHVSLILFAGVSIGAAVVLTMAYVRFAVMRSWFTFLSPAILLFPYLLVCRSPISHLVFVPHGPAPTYPAVNSKTPVVFVLFDELCGTSLMNDAHRVDAERFPNFAALQRDAIWFRNAGSVADVTTNAVPAVLSGMFPDRPRQPTLTDYPRNLFTMLGGAYQLDVSETITHLCPDSLRGAEVRSPSRAERLDLMMVDASILYLHLLLPDSLTKSLPTINQTWHNFDSDQKGHEAQTEGRPERMRRFITSIKATKRPQLFFVHAILPHVPFIYLPSGQQYAGTSEPIIFGMTGFEKWGADAFSVYKGFGRHLLQTGLVDRLLGEMMDRLKREGLYDRALIIVTADHGVCFRPSEGRRFVSNTNSCDILNVPLFIKLPAQVRGGTIDDRSVQSVDILPTIADVLGIDLRWSLDGRSLMDPKYVPRPRKVIFDQNFGPHEYPATMDAAYASLAEKPAVFHHGGLSAVYNYSEHAELVGKPLSEMTTFPSSTLHALLDASKFEDVHLRAPFLPVWVRGKIEGRPPGAPALDVVIAVNGRIAVVTRTGTGPDADKFSNLINPASLNQGENRVQLFILRDDGHLEAI